MRLAYSVRLSVSVLLSVSLWLSVLLGLSLSALAQEQPQKLEARPEVKAEPPVEELSLRQEIVVEGMGNAGLSGLTRCGESFWAVSNRDDGHLYRLVPTDKEAPASWQTEALPFSASSASASVPSVIPWEATVSRTVLGLLRGTYLDFEGIACNDRGDRYLVSESQAAVLQVPPEGEAFWLPLAEVPTRQAWAGGMLLHFNQLYRGIAVSPDGGHLWLAASRNKRSLLDLYFSGSSWNCRDSCELFAEGGVHRLPEAFGEDRVVDREFADMVYSQ